MEEMKSPISLGPVHIVEVDEKGQPSQIVSYDGLEEVARGTAGIILRGHLTWGLYED